MHYCAACCVFGVPQVFRRLDEDLDGVLSRGELNQFQVHTEGMEISEEVWRWLARTFDSDANGSLSAVQACLLPICFRNRATAAP